MAQSLTNDVSKELLKMSNEPSPKTRRGVKVYMNAKDAELLGETIIDYIDDEDMGRGYIIRGPEDVADGCSSCANAATCDHDHDHDSCDHDHGHEGCGCGHD